jgi:hypothetical protein
MDRDTGVVVDTFLSSQRIYASAGLALLAVVAGSGRYTLSMW